MSFFYGPGGDAGNGFTQAPFTGVNNENLEAAYKRDSTLDWKAKQTRKIATAYAHPDQFFNDKAAAIEAAAAKAARVYREELLVLTKQLVPMSIAHTRAMKMANGYEELLRADIEETFPSDLSNLSLQLTYDRGSAAQSGFARPSTHLSSKPAAAAPPRRKASRK